MEVESLAFRTDLALLQLAGGEVEDRGSHLAVRTPDNPTFRWGNFLLLPAAPAAEDVAAWEEEFRRTFPEADHRAFGVATAHGTRDDLAPLASAGMSTDASAVLTATATSLREPPRPGRTATYRPLLSDTDWEQQVALGLAGEEHPEPQFVAARNAARRRTVDAGLGTWRGAFLGDRLVASAGMFPATGGAWRFQDVKTHPDARGRGLAGTLVHGLGRWAFDQGASTLVIVADPEYRAVRVYRSLGFGDTETQLQAERAQV